jgi:hypothetical protein
MDALPRRKDSTEDSFISALLVEKKTFATIAPRNYSLMRITIAPIIVKSETISQNRTKGL